MRFLLLTLIVAFTNATALARDYYVSTSGNNGTNGDRSHPWASLDRLWSVCLEPGDRVLFRGGDVFPSRFYLNLNCAAQGTPASPITVTSYGTGRANLAGGVESEDHAGLIVTNIDVKAGAPNFADGIGVYSTKHDGVSLNLLHIENSEISGWGGAGISAGAWWSDSGGLNDFKVLNCTVHDNRKGGISLYGSAAGRLYMNKNAYVGYSSVFNNSGYNLAEFPASWKFEGTGNGILLGSVDGGTIEQCRAYNNGARNNYTDGPVGIMVYDSRNMLIQFNESFGNHTAIHDGNGFSLDRNTSSSTLQNNWSHDNDGVGLYLAQNSNQPFHFGNTVRYNLSQNDARKGAYAGLSLWGPMRDASVLNNRVEMSPSPFGSPSAVSISGASLPFPTIMTNVNFDSNVFVAAGPVPVLYSDVVAPSLTFHSDWYFGSPLTILWEGVLFGSVQDWSTATGQER